VGLLDRLRGQSRVTQARPPARISAPVVPARLPTTSRQRSSARTADWLPAHSSVVIAGYTITGGLLYVGSSLPSTRAGGGTDPALIDPRLPVGRIPDRSGQRLTYWPGYSAISPNERAAYLEWLSYGRNNPHAPIGYVFLYFYGLERRILIDCARTPALRAELPGLRAEVERLLSIYGTQNSLRRYATGLLGLVDLMLGQHIRKPPAYTGEKWAVPIQLRIALGEFCRARAPIPALWAMSWALFSPEVYPRTPVERCADEFARLFGARYAARFGPGMVITKAQRTVTVEYQPASAGLAQTGWDTKLPDVFELEAPSKVLATILEGATDELDAYSRWLGRHPEGRDTLPALALLPPILIDARKEPVSSLRAMLIGRLAGADQALIDGLDLIEAWSGDHGPKLTKQDSTALAQLLAGQGFGLEPDPRFGGSPLGSGPAVVFRIQPESAPRTASAAYTSAATIVRLAAAVAAADTSTTAEQDYLVAHLESVLELSSDERGRLRAHLCLLLSSPVKLTGMAARITDLGTDEREMIARLCLDVAAADGVIAPAEVATLSKVYKLLALPETRLFQDIHAAAANATEPAQEPITVGLASAPTSTGNLVPAAPPADGKPGLGLDRAAISAKVAETARVSELLGSIFVEDEAPPERLRPEPTGVIPLIGSLDSAHSRLLHDLAASPTWPRAAVEDLCAELGLLTDGALEVLNDAAYECAGDPAVMGVDPLEIDFDVIEEMQR
jgi:tellurite resistance protein